MNTNQNEEPDDAHQRRSPLQSAYQRIARFAGDPAMPTDEVDEKTNVDDDVPFEDPGTDDVAVTDLGQQAGQCRVGLALGGGGARGIAHVGVLTVLEDAGIPIDCLAGTSMGGIVAAPYAVGYTAKQIAAEAVRLGSLSNILRFVDWQLPTKGLLQGQAVFAYLGKQLGAETTFTDLKRPLALTTVDLNTGREVVLDSGLVTEAVRASMAIPGIIAPVEMGDAKLVDGGILNNVPADIVRAMNVDIVIAVDVSVGRLIADPRSGFNADQAIRSVLLPDFALDMWRAQAIMMQNLVRYKLEQAKPDVLISPPVPPDVTTFSFHRVAELIEIGQNAARAALPQIREAIESKRTGNL